MNQFIKAFAGCLAAMLWSCLLYAQPNVTRVEYYLDSDPGYNNATAISITPGVNLSNIALNINPATLTAGVHIVGIRAKDANGAWSQDNRWLFAKPYASDTTTPGPVPKLSRVEYYIDGDPGYGKATAVSFTAATNLSDIALNIDPATLTAGVHTLGIRARDANGGWSHDNRLLFAKPYASDTTGPGPLPNITKVEYYLDTDPGYGAATPVSITAGVNLSDLTVNIDTASIAEGVHILGIRAKDAKGAWSLDNRWLFARPFASDSTGPGSIPNLKQVEYYIDTDPGYGKGTAVATDNVANLANFNLSVNISGLATGSHTIYIRSKDANNAWSLDNKFDFNVSAAVASPSITLNSIAQKKLCAGDVFSVGFDAKGTFNNGNVFTVQLSNSTGSFASPVAIGSVTGKISAVVQCTLPSGLSTGTGYKLRAVSSSPAVTSNVSADALNITALPATPTITAGGSTTFCQGGNVMLTSSAASSYKWSTGAVTQSITASTSGSYTVTVANSNGCTATSAPTTVTVNANPAPTTTPAGNVTIPSGGNTNITVNESYAAYLWSTNATTQSITVSTAGSYTCTVTNSNGCTGTTAPVVVSVAVACPKPTITASVPVTNVCPGTKVTLTASKGTSYSWSTGATTQKIMVSAAGSYMVTEPSSCGNVTSDPTVVTYQTCGNPTGLVASGITASAATLSWTGVSCGTKYNVQYRKSGTTAWTTAVATGTSITVTGLTANTTYNWQVQTVCTTPKSGYTKGTNFKTAASLIADVTSSSTKEKSTFNAVVYPNPASTSAVLNISGTYKPVTATLSDITGKVLWKSGNVTSSHINLPVANLSAAVYVITVTDGNETKILRLVKGQQ